MLKLIANYERGGSKMFSNELDLKLFSGHYSALNLF